MFETIVGLIGLLLFLAPFTLIVRKAGYSPLWVFLGFVPVVNLFALVLFALSEWPIEREMQQMTRGPKSPEDSEAETSWELKRLAKRVSLVEELAASQGTNEHAKQLLDTIGATPTEYLQETINALLQFVERATHDEKEFAERLLSTTRGLEGRLQDV